MIEDEIKKALDAARNMNFRVKKIDLARLAISLTRVRISLHPETQKTRMNEVESWVGGKELVEQLAKLSSTTLSLLSRFPVSP